MGRSTPWGGSSSGATYLGERLWTVMMVVGMRAGESWWGGLLSRLPVLTLGSQIVPVKQARVSRNLQCR